MEVPHSCRGLSARAAVRATAAVTIAHLFSVKADCFPAFRMFCASGATGTERGHCCCARRLCGVSQGCRRQFQRIRILDDYTSCKAHIGAPACFQKRCRLKCDYTWNATIWKRLKAYKNTTLNEKQHKDSAADVGINAFHGFKEHFRGMQRSRRAIFTAVASALRERGR